MTRSDAGPPGEGGGDPTAEAASRTITSSRQSTSRHSGRPGKELARLSCRTRPGRHAVGADNVAALGLADVGDLTAQLRRRREASRRVIPLDCGCRDGWTCRCTDPPLSEAMIDAGRAAARHILSVGKTPLLATEILRALWRRGGEDRQLAEQLHQLTGGQLA